MLEGLLEEDDEVVQVSSKVVAQLFSSAFISSFYFVETFNTFENVTAITISSVYKLLFLFVLGVLLQLVLYFRHVCFCTGSRPLNRHSHVRFVQ